MLDIILFTAFFFKAAGCGLFITNTSCWFDANNGLVWNTTGVGGNLENAPNIILANVPWFFPLITMVLILITDYQLALKKGFDTKVNLFAVILAYTMVGYIEVAGSLADTGWFYFFELLTIIAIFIMTLFPPKPSGM